MLNARLPALVVVAAWTLVTGCGYVCDKTKTFCSSSAEDEPRPIASMSMTPSAAAPASSFEFFSSTACDFDPDSGLLKVQYLQGDRELDMQVRGFSADPRAYDCRQAPNNNDAAEHVGDLFETCMIEAKTPHPGLMGSDHYAMHRSSTLTKPAEAVRANAERLSFYRSRSA